MQTGMLPVCMLTSSLALACCRAYMYTTAIARQPMPCCCLRPCSKLAAQASGAPSDVLFVLRDWQVATFLQRSMSLLGVLGRRVIRADWTGKGPDAQCGSNNLPRTRSCSRTGRRRRRRARRATRCSRRATGRPRSPARRANSSTGWTMSRAPCPRRCAARSSATAPATLVRRARRIARAPGCAWRLARA